MRSMMFERIQRDTGKGGEGMPMWASLCFPSCSSLHSVVTERARTFNRGHMEAEMHEGANHTRAHTCAAAGTQRKTSHTSHMSRHTRDQAGSGACPTFALSAFTSAALDGDPILW